MSMSEIEELNESALSMLVPLLADIKKRGEQPITSQLIESLINEITEIRRFLSVDKDWLRAELERRFTRYIEIKGGGLTDRPAHHWLNAKKGEIEWKFWSRYRRYLLQKLDYVTVNDIVDDVSDKVLDSLEDPTRNGKWTRRGLVVGNVQSGKTQTYVGLVCKAADAGYKVIVVLAGLHNTLRSQTQVRLDEGFVGFKATFDNSNGPRERTGVYFFDDTPKAHSVTTRDENGDFRAVVARHLGVQPGGDNPLLFVIKKNVTPLKNLIEWIESFARDEDPESGRKFIKDTSILVIDDESDQASVDTKKMGVDNEGNPDPEHEPVKINRYIRKLLNAFDKSAYVGFTATPFANILINDSNWTKELGDDLFPKSFIYNLPAPDHYFGPEKIFGLKEDIDVGIEEHIPIPVVKTVKDYIDSTEDPKVGWMPEKINKDHVPRYMGQDDIPPSLHEAIYSFILSTTVRAIREDKPHHCSMLIHVTRLTDVQSKVTNQVKRTIRQLADRVNYGDGNFQPTLIEILKGVWTREFVSKESFFKNYEHSKKSLPDWSEIEKNLKKVINSIVIREVNGRALEFLEYEEHENVGLNVIAIGGEKLSRGLTLEGLTISYFLRTSDMYDTLMQMGRWFGYKKEYIDVSRLYTTIELQESYRNIASATLEMRNAFEDMQLNGEPPSRYGMRIRSHAGMLVTSKVKMRSGVKIQLNYSGDLNQTVVFHKDPEVTRSNFNAATNLLEKYGKDNYAITENHSFLWKDIEAKDIINFLATYKTHDDAVRVNNELLIKYIEKKMLRGELENWSVLIASIKIESGRENDFSNFFWNMNVGGAKRSNLSIDSKDKYTIKVLVDPRHESLDLNIDDQLKALNESIELWDLEDPESRPASPPSHPNGRIARKYRNKRNGFLMLYPLKFEDSAIPVLGYAISFPRSDNDDTVEYIVNSVFSRTSI